MTGEPVLTISNELAVQTNVGGLQAFINEHFTHHLNAITVHHKHLLALVNGNAPDTEDLSSDLAKVMKGRELFDSSLMSLVKNGLPDVDEPCVTPISRLRHDLRTPLNAIMGYTELFSEKLGQHDYAPQHCRAILDAAEALSHSTDRLCDKLQSAKNSDGPVLASNTDITQHLQRIAERNAASSLTGRILVVDDVEDNRALLNRYLVPEGHDVCLASSGLQALQMIETVQYDLILLDIMMPDLNGLQVLEQLKASESHRQIPIIVISGLADVDAVAPCIAAGAEDYLTKPFNSMLLKARINACLQKKIWGDKERSYLKEIEAEKNRSEAILSAILPAPIIDRLKSSNDPIADRVENVTILFADIVGFTPAAERMSPEKLLQRLDILFSGFDELTDKYGVEKIKTIGDAYMAACGVPLPSVDHIDRVLDLACDILDYVNQVENTHDSFQLRIGIHTGPVIAGLVGRQRYVYDLWGETVNLASRIEASGAVNRISVSNEIVKGASTRFRFDSLGCRVLKGIGKTEIYTLVT